jgi:hypothetical protein
LLPLHYYLEVGGRIIQRCILRDIGWNGMDWIDLAQDRGQWRALMNTIINLQVP